MAVVPWSGCVID